MREAKSVEQMLVQMAIMLQIIEDGQNWNHWEALREAGSVAPATVVDVMRYHGAGFRRVIEEATQT